MINHEQLQAMTIIHYNKLRENAKRIDHTLSGYTPEEFDLHYEEIIFKIKRTQTTAEILAILIENNPGQDINKLPEALGMILTSNLLALQEYGDDI